MPSYDPIADTERHFQQVSEQRLPTAGLSEPVAAAVVQSRLTGIPGDFRPQPSDLVDMAIQGRQQFEQRRQSLINQLPFAHRRQAGAIHAELQAMAADEHERQAQARERRIMAHQNLQQNLELAKVDRETDIDEHGAALVQALPHLRAMLRNGQISKDEYDSGVLDVIGKYGTLGMHHPGAAQLVNHYLEEADKQNAFTQRRSISEATKIAAKYGIDPQIDPDTGEPSIELTRQAALQSDKGRGEVLKGLNEEMKQKYGLGVGVASLFNPVVPHTDADKGKSINLPYLDPKTGTAGAVKVPKPLFETMKADFQDRYFSVVPQQPSPQARNQITPRSSQDLRTLPEWQADVRRVGGVDYKWNGNKWEPTSQPQQPSGKQPITVGRVLRAATTPLPMLPIEMENDPEVNPNPPVNRLLR